MISNKHLRILNFLFLCTFAIISCNFLPSDSNTRKDFQKNSTAKGSSYSGDITKHISDETFLNRYYHLLGETYNIEEENSQVTNENDSFKKVVYTGIIAYRKGDYTLSFSLLKNVFSGSIKEYEYFDALISSAAFSQQKKEALSLLQSIDDNHNAYLLYGKGSLALSSADYKQAIVYLTNALNLDPESGKILLKLSECYKQTGNYDRALSILISAQGKSQQHNICSDEITNQIGTIYFLMGKYDKANSSFSQSCMAAQKSKFVSLEARSTINLGIIEDIKGNSPAAIKNMELGIALAKQINSPDIQALGYSELGVTYANEGNKLNAIENYQKGLIWYEVLNNTERLSLINSNLGNLYINLGDYLPAKKYFEAGLTLAGQNQRAYSLNSIGLGDIYTNLGNYGKAIQYYEDVKSRIAKDSVSDVHRNLTLSLGALNFNIGRYSSAAASYAGYIAGVKNSPNDPFYLSEMYHNLGLSQSALDSIPSALTSLQNAEKLAEQAGDVLSSERIQSDVAFILLKTGHSAQAAKIIQKLKAHNVFKSDDDKLTLYLLDATYNNAAHLYNETVKIFYAGTSVALKTKIRDLSANFFFETGKAFEELRKFETADSLFKMSLQYVENISASLFAHSKIQVAYLASEYSMYNHIVDFYIRQNKYKDAFYILDRSRSRNSFLNLAQQKLTSISKNDNELSLMFEYDWMIHSGFYPLRTLDSIKIAYNRLYNRIAANISPYFFDKDISSAHFISALQKDIAANTAIISVYTNKEKSYIFVIKDKSFDVVESQVSPKELNGMIAAISPFYAKPLGKELNMNADMYAFNNEASHILFKKFFKSAFDKIPEHSKVLFIAPAELYAFPLDILVKSHPEGTSYYDYQKTDFLVNHYCISTIPSASINHILTHAATNSNKNCLLMGSPLFHSSSKLFAERRGLFDESPGVPRNLSMLPLRYSSQEVNDIASEIGNITLLTEKDATESNFKKYAPAANLIHLSTHSWLIKNQPVIFFSSVEDKENDGFLEASEVAQLKLNADLVVLSSCNSGQGSPDVAEGILGMTKAFMDAGAKSVITTMWEINDHYSSEFMKLFYQNLSRGMDKSSALQNAKITFIQKFSANPYYWSPYILSGNTSAMEFDRNISISSYAIPFGIVLIFVTTIVLVSSKRKSFRKVI